MKTILVLSWLAFGLSPLTHADILNGPIVTAPDSVYIQPDNTTNPCPSFPSYETVGNCNSLWDGFPLGCTYMGESEEKFYSCCGVEAIHVSGQLLGYTGTPVCAKKQYYSCGGQYCEVHQYSSCPLHSGGCYIDAFSTPPTPIAIEDTELKISFPNPPEWILPSGGGGQGN